MEEEVAKATQSANLTDLMELIERREFVNVFDKLGNGPFHYAVARNNVAVLDYLIEKHRRYINTQNFIGQTPLFKAVLEGRYALVEKLIFAGADVNIPNNTNMSPIHVATYTPRITKILIQHGANVNCIDNNGETALHNAVECENLETTYTLLYYNADPSIANELDYTPFMVAVENENIEMQEALFEYVDDYDKVSITFDGELSLLGFSLLYNSPYSQEMILRGANVNNVSKEVNGVLSVTLYKPRGWGPLDLDTFELVWLMMDYEPIEAKSILGSLSVLDTEEFHIIIDIFIDYEEKCAVIAESVSGAGDFATFIELCIERQLPLETFSVLLSALVTYGYTLSEKDFAVIFNHWGYCEIFKYACCTWT